MAKEMLINVSEGEECRIALVEGGVLEELYMERASSTSHVNNIYKGRVVNVEPSIQAAFIDFGLGRNGFLHISDLMPTYFGRKGEDIQESVGRKMARRDRPPIQRCLRRGDEIVVQVIKEGIGTKGPTLSTYLSIPGKILVMMPGMVSKGVSRKIEDDEERRRLRQILDQLDPPEDIGFILRTAGVGKSKQEIERDLKYLLRLWQTIEKKRDSTPGPVELYTEGDLVSRTVRDVFTTDVDRIIIDHKEVAEQVREVIKLSTPRTRNKVELYDEPIPLFHKYGIEKEIERMYSRHVPLPSGGSLVIDSTEAIVAIDVNSGKFREHNDAEMTAFKTDMEAADEICRQLRLRDLGGVIICDFIDLRYERHRRELEDRLIYLLNQDRAKTKVLRMSEFGIIEMTRQRMRPSFKRSVYFDCPHCKGAGLVKTPESMSLDVMRRLAIAANDQRVVRVELSIGTDVAFYLQNRKRQQLADLEHHTGKQVLIRPDPSLGLDEMKLSLFDHRDGVVMIDELSAALSAHPHTSQINVRQPHQQRGGRGADRRDDRRPQRPAQPQPRHRDELGDDEDVMEDRANVLEEQDQDMAMPSPVVPQQRVPSQPPRQDEDRPQHGRPPRQQQGRPPSDRQQQGRGPQDRPFNRGPQDRQQQGRPPQLPGGRPQRSDFDNEATSDGAEEPLHTGENGSPVSSENDFGDEQGGRKRRRRRRGRRGRGRGRQDQGVNPQEQPATAGDARDESPRDESPRDDRTDEQRREDESSEQELFERGDREIAGDSEAPAFAYEREPDSAFYERAPEPRESDSREAAAAPQSEEPDAFDRREERGPSPADDRSGRQDAEEYTEENLPWETPSSSPASGEQPAALPDPDPDVAQAKPARKPRAAAASRRKPPKAAAAKPKRAENAATAKKPVRRVGRGGKKKGSAAPPAESETGGQASGASEVKPAPRGRRAVPADKHLADDEPVLHEPLRRPRSARDLDHIPDDFD